jgi:hypothetical protein
MKPYSDTEKQQSRFIRTFSSETPLEELVWHRDEEDRIVEIIQSDGWRFQFDNELPFDMVNGDFIKIPKDVWHRIHKGTGDLIINITE